MTKNSAAWLVRLLLAALTLVVCLPPRPARLQAGAANGLPVAATPGTYLLRPATGGVVALGDVPYGGVVWQPDGSHVAVVANSGDSETISVVDASTGQKTQLAQVAGHVFSGGSPTMWWSPDGSRLAYALQGSQPGGSALYVAPLSGQAPMLIAPFAPQSLAWTPDGTAVTVVQPASNTFPFIHQVVTLNATTGAQELINVPASGGLCPLTLSWSADGAYLAFAEGGIGNNVCEGNESSFGLWVWVAATGKPAQLTTGKVIGSAAGAQQAQWLPNDQLFAQIDNSAVIVPANGSAPVVLNASVSTGLANPPAAFANGTLVWGTTAGAAASVGCTNSVVWVQDPGSSTPRQLSDAGADASAPALSPDGRSVLWSSDNTSSVDLVLASIDGSMRQTLVQGAASFTDYGWSPDGSAVSFTASSSPADYIYRQPPCPGT